MVSWCAGWRGGWGCKKKKKMEERELEERAEIVREEIETGEGMMKMMAGLINELSKAWHVPLCRIRVSWHPEPSPGQMDSLFAILPLVPFIHQICSASPPYHCPVITDQYRWLLSQGSLRHCSCSNWVGWMCIIQPLSLIMTFKAKGKWQTST